MLSFNHKAAAKEEAIARRALELFLEVQGLPWADSYELAAYEQATPPVRFQRVLESIKKGKTFDQAKGRMGSHDPEGVDASGYAWEKPEQVRL